MRFGFLSLAVASVLLVGATTSSLSLGGALDVAAAPDGSNVIRVLPGASGVGAVIVKNNGSKPADASLQANIDVIWSGYSISLAEPACGVLTHDVARDVTYTLALPTLLPNDSIVCHFAVNRGTSAYAASDLPLSWNVMPGDGEPGPAQADFVVGSLDDLSLQVEPQSFKIDGSGFAHERVALTVRSSGPSDVSQFIVGGCDDHGELDFELTGDFEGGCGASDFHPLCVDFGVGFSIPAMNIGDKYTCAIELTSIEPYERPLGFGVYTSFVLNPATGGGEILDPNPTDNSVTLILAPFADPLFVDGFDAF
jgi:hypothetical protein